MAQLTEHRTRTGPRGSDRGQARQERCTLLAGLAFRQHLHRITANGDYNGRAEKRKMGAGVVEALSHGVDISKMQSRLHAFPGSWGRAATPSAAKLDIPPTSALPASRTCVRELGRFFYSMNF